MGEIINEFKISVGKSGGKTRIDRCMYEVNTEKDLAQNTYR
jgi:hypothetical protein